MRQIYDRMNYINKSKVSKKILFNINFWIVIFFLARLYGITEPPLETGHNWRQTTVTMVVRNFIEVDNNIFYPRIDIAGELSGITGMEFPIYNYLIYLVSLLFGYQDWYGRLINLIISSIGVRYFYLLIKKYFTKEIAFNSSFILLSTLWLTFSRKIMPDTFSVSLILMSIYYGSNYLDSKKSWSNLLLYFVLGLFGFLAKLPIGYLFILLVPFIFKKNIELKRKIIFSLSSVFIIIPVAWWYFIWVPYLVEEFGFWHFYMGNSFTEGFQLLITQTPQLLDRFYQTALKFIGFIVFAFGLFKVYQTKNTRLKLIFTLTGFGITVIMIKAGFAFPHHSYYMVPYVPIMALIAGFGLTFIKDKKWVVLLLFAILIENIADKQQDFYIKEPNIHLTKLEEEFDHFSTRSDLILINSGNYPTPMYFTHRKGWVTSNETISKPAYLTEIKNKGCKYLLVLKESFGTNIDLPLEIIRENEHWKIYQL